MESRGWKVERIWSRNWWRDSEKEIERIKRKIEELRRTDSPLAGGKSDPQDTNRPSEEQRFEESPSSISPKTPFSNKIRFRKAVESCEGYILWVDKYFPAYGLELLAEYDKSHVREIKILTSLLKVDDKLKRAVIDFSKEIKNQGITFELRVLNNKQIYKDIHDRWIISKNVCFNVPS